MTREAAIIDAGSIFRGIVLRLILAEQADPTEMKARIMIAREHGHLDDEAVDDLITTYSLEAA